MNDNMFVVDYDPFAKDSRIIVIQDGQRTMLNVSSDIPDLITQLIDYSKKYDLYDVKFHAPVNVFYEVERQMGELEKTMYNENKIKMEIC